MFNTLRTTAAVPCILTCTSILGITDTDQSLHLFVSSRQPVALKYKNQDLEAQLTVNITSAFVFLNHVITAG